MTLPWRKLIRCGRTKTSDLRMLVLQCLFTGAGPKTTALTPVVIAYATTQGIDPTPFVLLVGMFGAGYYTVSEQLKAAFAVGIFAWLAWAATALVWFPVIGLI